MARIPDASAIRISSAANQRAPAVRATGEDFGAGVAKAAGQFADATFKLGIIEREKEFRRDEAGALNELATTLPDEIERIVTEERARIQPGAKGYAEAVKARLDVLHQQSLEAVKTRFRLRQPAIDGMKLNSIKSVNAALKRAKAFEALEGRRQAIVDADRLTDKLRIGVLRNPSRGKLMVALEATKGLVENDGGIFTRAEKVARLRVANQTLVLTYFKGLIQRSPGQALAELKSMSPERLAELNIGSQEVSVIRRAAKQKLRAFASLAEKAKRLEQSDFLASVEIKVRRGEFTKDNIEEWAKQGRISPRTRVGLLIIADRVAESNDQLLRTAAVKGQRLNILEIERSGVIFRDDTVRQLVKTGILTVEGARALFSRQAKREKEIKAKKVRSERFSQIQSGIGRYDPTDPEDRKDFNKAFETGDLVSPLAVFRQALADPKRSDRAQTDIVNMIGKAGMVPDSVLGLIESGLRSGDEKKIARAAGLVDRILAENPKLRPELGKIKNLNFVLAVSQGIRNGDTPARAIELATTSVIQAKEPEFQARAKEYAKNRKSFEFANALLVENEFGRRTVEIPFVARTDTSAFLAELNREVERRFVSLGDIDLARETAMASMRLIWGVTHIGPPRLMRLPPHLVEAYKQPGIDNEKWMGEELLKDVSPLILREKADLRGRIRLVLPAGQERAARPGYMVLFEKPNGEFTPVKFPDGRVLWRPDWKNSAEFKRQEGARKKQLEEARKAREAAAFARESGF